MRRKPSGSWEARYRDGLGRMHARSFATKTDARRWAKEVETDVRRGDWVDPRLARSSFASWADQYLATLVHLRAVTRADDELALRNHVLPTFGDWPIAQIEQVNVRRLLADRQAAGLGPKSLQKVRLVLRQVLEVARGSGAIKVTRATASGSHEPNSASRCSSPSRRPNGSHGRRDRPTTPSCGSPS